MSHLDQTQTHAHDDTSTAPAPARERVLLVGGSVAAGLGVRGRPFGHRYHESASRPPEVLDLTESGRMIDELDGRLDEITRFAPDVALVCAGMSEHLVHPPRFIQDRIERFAPAGWHGVAGLQPRPYFSRSRRTRLRQKITSWLKVQVKRVTLLVGSRQRMTNEDFERRLVSLLDRLHETATTTVVVLTWPVDRTLFPRTNAAYASLDAVLRTTAEGRADVVVLDPVPLLHRWDDFLADRFHWNEHGHDLVAREAERLVAQMRAASAAVVS